jgi:exopolysaccharide production protein ExoZ
MSLFIVMYHYGAWLELDFVNLIFKAYGRYAVSIFYILSGFALFHVYMNRLNTISDVKKFLKKRLKRVYPLFFVVTILTALIFTVSEKNHITLYKLFENLSLIFSINNWSNPIASGAWSIGNEIVFYVFFSVVFYKPFSRFSNLIIYITLVLSIIYGINAIPNTGEKMNETMWVIYTNPFYQIKFFILGFLLYKLQNYHLFKFLNLKKGLVSSLKWTLLFSVFLFSYLFSSINPIASFYGIIGTIISCVLIILFSYDFQINNLFKILNKALFKLGTISYSLYLLHPIVYYFFKFSKGYFVIDFVELNYFIYFFMILVAIIISNISFKQIETRFK